MVYSMFACFPYFLAKKSCLQLGFFFWMKPPLALAINLQIIQQNVSYTAMSLTQRTKQSANWLVDSSAVSQSPLLVTSLLVNKSLDLIWL